MAKSGRGGRRTAGPPARQDAPGHRALLDRILDAPHLARAIPHLAPQVLYRVIETLGLTDSSDLVALATPEQLKGIFDLDLWRASRAGLDEQFDADRFGTWLDVLMECGAAIAAEKLLGLDIDLVTTGLAQHIRVFDAAALALSREPDGEPAFDPRGRTDESCEIGGYLVLARRGEAWHTIVDLLLFLDGAHPDYFHHVMCGCRRLSNAGFEIDGLDDLLADRDQHVFDLASAREERRERQGYAAPADARAFLDAARQLRIEEPTPPPPCPIARAYFRAIEADTPAEPDAEAVRGAGDARGPRPSDAPSAVRAGDDDAAAAVATVLEMLHDAGVVARQPRGLLNAAGGETRLAHLQAHLQTLHEHDAAAGARATDALAFLTNTIASGCSIQGRPFSAREASDAVAATCNLGLEQWPRQWDAAERDVLTAFQVGWAVLHRRVCMHAAECLIAALEEVRCVDRDVQSSLDELRLEMTKHWTTGMPWRACESLDAILSLDTLAWAALLGLIAECPVLHAGIGASRGSRVRTVDPGAFAFISTEAQIASARAFLRRLPQALTDAGI